jgi:hypothetical protein
MWPGSSHLRKCHWQEGKERPKGGGLKGPAGGSCGVGELVRTEPSQSNEYRWNSDIVLEESGTIMGSPSREHPRSSPTGVREETARHRKWSGLYVVSIEAGGGLGGLPGGQRLSVPICSFNHINYCCGISSLYPVFLFS